MEAAVDQCSVDKNDFEIQIKQLQIDNDKLLNQIMSQDIMHIAMNYVDILDVSKTCVNECCKCLELETELLKKKDFIEKEVYDKLVKSYSTLEKHCISLELETQLQQEIFQEDNSVIRKLKERIKSLMEKEGVENVKKDIDEIETINIELEHSVAKLLSENKNLRKEREHLKSIFKDQFDSIKQTRVRSKEHTLKNELRKLKGKNVVDTAVSKPAATIAPGMFKINLEPLAPTLLNNREAHMDYLKHTREQTAFLREIIEQGRSLNPLDSAFDYACKYVTRIQELLVYATQSCPSFNKPSEKLVAVTPMNKDKKVRFAEPVTSSNKMSKQTDSLKTTDSNKPLLPFTGVNSTTSASGSKPSGNTKKNRITRPSSSNEKNKVETHPRTVKSSLNKTNVVFEPISNALVKHSVRNAKFETLCATCNKCLFDTTHDMFLINFMNNVNVRSKSKFKRNKKRKEWKPMVMDIQKRIKIKIKEWNQRNMKDLKSGKAKLKEDLEALDADIDKGNGTADMVTKRSEVVNSLQEIDKLQTMEIAQKAKIKWCIEGDENSSFFHGMLNKRRSQLSIRGIMVDGVWIEDPLKVKREFYQHFSNRFAKPVDQRAHINMEYPNTITLEQQIDLECDVTKEELKKAVWDCGIDKSPGPDGFTFGFYRRFWSTIENDVFEAVKYFFNSGAIPNGCNSSFIALIPKIPDANLVKDFRPISLIGSMYKIIAKILANRLVGVLGDIVNEVQSAFIAERQILDGPFILNEVLQWCKLKKKQSLIFKVDFEKAFDSIRWDFLDDILKKFGFGDKWCNWIQSCLRSSRGSIIINGSPTEEFYFQKGLKQGDPLSPFLFILVMESLHLSFQRVVDAGMFKGVQLNPSLNLSHMFYADDAVFVGQWCDDNINILTHVLDCFYWASGLRINMSKSKIMGILVADDKVKSAATKLGCLMLNTPFSYLGTKVGGSMSRTHAWEEVIDKVRSRLSRWKMKTLSIGGRLTLLKSVLGSMPIFHMSIFKAPLSVIRQLESIRSHFFNGHDSASRKASWIKWDCVLAPKEKGGLGVSSLYALNRALMFKWVWRFYSQNSSLWARVMKAIHGDDGRIGKDIKACNQSCWLNIVNEINVLKNQGINFLDFMRLKLGNGNNISFWNDNWIGGNTLKNLYPRIYALENSKQVTVCAKLADIALDASFRRKPRGGIECIQFNEMLVLMQDVSLTPISDRWIWSLEGSGDFSVASTRKAIDDKRLPVVNSKTRWIKSVPIKVNVHAWKVKLDALPTRFNISRRGIVLDSILCPICNTGVESSSHLFFTCNLARQLSCKISQWWVTPFVEVNSYGEWRSWLVSLRLSSKHKLILEGVFYVMWWHLWSYRNKLLFDSKIPLKAMIFDDIVSGSFYWCRYRCKASFSWNDWLKNPYLVSL
ncbi:RNA-directed DNA polymerase, eukaryota [Tanacetum coccineum]|uniref:RNA-directed DNA polymerase, eukaryota n=1 Tax=Tanacetum coccineum TaxID=301880 RepID=A0ABQ5EZR4_9ASTR